MVRSLLLFFCPLVNRLHSLFGADLPKMLDLAENTSVSVHVGDQSKRWFFRVHGSDRNALPYITTPWHCNCMAYLNQVVVQNTHVYCKHQVGALLAETLQRVTAYSVPDADIGAELVRMQPAKQSYGSRGGWRGRGRGGSGSGGGGGGDGSDGGGGGFDGGPHSGSGTRQQDAFFRHQQ